jgi:hypothetical protein
MFSLVIHVALRAHRHEIETAEMKLRNAGITAVGFVMDDPLCEQSGVQIFVPHEFSFNTTLIIGLASLRCIRC